MFPVCVIYQLSQEGFWMMILIIGEIDILYIPQGRISLCSIGRSDCLDRQRHFQRWGPYVASWMPIVACSWPPRSGFGIKFWDFFGWFQWRVSWRAKEHAMILMKSKWETGGWLGIRIQKVKQSCEWPLGLTDSWFFGAHWLMNYWLISLSKTSHARVEQPFEVNFTPYWWLVGGWLVGGWLPFVLNHQS